MGTHSLATLPTQGSSDNCSLSTKAIGKNKTGEKVSLAQISSTLEEKKSCYGYTFCSRKSMVCVCVCVDRWVLTDPKKTENTHNHPPPPHTPEIANHLLAALPPSQATVTLPTPNPSPPPILPCDQYGAHSAFVQILPTYSE